MPIAQITPSFSVSGELNEAEFHKLAANRVRTLVNVRPDNESAEQVNSYQWQDLAQLHHMQYCFIPVKSFEYCEDDIARFAALLKQSISPVHAICRTGTRAIHLWALASKDEHTYEHMQKLAKKAGYDLDKIATLFDN
jgi:uncharacterized protein (TIGR01244 family)